MGRPRVRNQVCHYCGGHADTLDHIVPRSKGGGRTSRNIVFACKACNNRKSDKWPEPHCKKCKRAINDWVKKQKPVPPGAYPISAQIDPDVAAALLTDR